MGVVSEMLLRTESKFSLRWMLVVHLQEECIFSQWCSLKFQCTCRNDWLLQVGIFGKLKLICFPQLIVSLGIPVQLCSDFEAHCDYLRILMHLFLDL